MATHDTNRVTKDISARKQPQGMSAAEVKATEAYYNTLLNARKDDHDEEIKNQQAAHLEEIAILKTEWEKQNATHVAEVASLKAEWEKQKKSHVGSIMLLKSQLEKATTITSQKEKEIFEAAEAKARKDSSDRIAQLNQRVEDSKNQVSRNCQNYFKSLKEKEGEVALAKVAATKAQEDLRNKEAAKDHEIALLKRKIAIEVKFRCKGGRTRTYLLRPHSRFKEAVGEFCKEVGKEVEQMRFYVSDRPMDGLPKAEWDSTPAVRQLVPGIKTLQGVCWLPIFWSRSVEDANISLLARDQGWR